MITALFAAEFSAGGGESSTCTVLRVPKTGRSSVASKVPRARQAQSTERSIESDEGAQGRNLRDTLNEALGAMMGTSVMLGTTDSWIYGAFFDETGDLYTGSLVTVSAPSEAMLACHVYYTCELQMGGPCADGGPFRARRTTSASSS
jgi:hypothetical protein